MIIILLKLSSIVITLPKGSHLLIIVENQPSFKWNIKEIRSLFLAKIMQKSSLRSLHPHPFKRGITINYNPDQILYECKTCYLKEWLVSSLLFANNFKQKGNKTIMFIPFERKERGRGGLVSKKSEIFSLKYFNIHRENTQKQVQDIYTALKLLLHGRLIGYC